MSNLLGFQGSIRNVSKALITQLYSLLDEVHDFQSQRGHIHANTTTHQEIQITISFRAIKGNLTKSGLEQVIVGEIGMSWNISTYV